MTTFYHNALVAATAGILAAIPEIAECLPLNILANENLPEEDGRAAVALGDTVETGAVTTVSAAEATCLRA